MVKNITGTINKIFFTYPSMSPMEFKRFNTFLESKRFKTTVLLLIEVSFLSMAQFNVLPIRDFGNTLSIKKSIAEGFSRP